jgi:hypothetical protein
MKADSKSEGRGRKEFRVSESGLRDLVFGSGPLVLCFAFTAFALATTVLGASKPQPSPVSLGKDGRLAYLPDSRGNRVPDFSRCGYAGGDQPIPDVPIRVVVAPAKGDSTDRIQSAIDYVAGLPADGNGIRGAVLLLKGRHEISGGLRITVSGVVLRGQGMGADGTVLVATGLDRRTLIRVVGRNDRANADGKSWTIKDEYVPVGTTSFHLDGDSGLKVGDTITITRPSTQPWIDKLQMVEFGGVQGDWRLVWKPGSRDIVWDRVVQAVEGDLVTVDAPITTALDRDFGGGRVEPYQWPGRLNQVGVENLRCESVFDVNNPKDENHSWFGITMENVQNGWVRQVTATHFAGSLAAIYETCKWVTVEDCLSLEPISEEGGYRRHTFFTMGDMTLFLRCHAEHGRHDFSVGHCAAGPNAFVQCDATLPLGDSGPIESWASGVLYDCVTIDGNGLSLANRGPNPHGAGWSAANSVLWQCSASVIRCANPPGACNWAFGCWGEFEGDGIWRSANESVRPYSLYVAQLSDRLGRERASRVKLLVRSTDESSNPSLEQAAALIAASQRPAPKLADFITAAPQRNPIPCEPAGCKTIEEVGISIAHNESFPGRKALKPVAITNGWLVCDGRLLIGRRTEVPWWEGNIRPTDARKAKPDVTRFVPGRMGRGFTDQLDEVADELQTEKVAALDHNYGLWYERRRDDHERVRRINGDVWPPFYEMPFARTGHGTAWNGLSLYDLTKYNPWYWSRLKQFADLCDERGLVLLHENYFQHNILEAGAHWADCPWRDANNINAPGFPEPPPYAGDKRIFMAEQFYDVTNTVRRALHREYIRQCLTNFAENSNVIQFTSAEFTGPRSFVEFWLETIAEWERETGRSSLVALSCTKDVQDAILADENRSPVVNMVDFKYWWMADKGTFAPKGGQNLAPRQFERPWKGGRPNDRNLARMASDYRRQFPGKAIICDFPQGSWAFACAGGSMANLPGSTDSSLLAAIPRMRPWSEANTEQRWVLREPGSQYLVYCGSADSAEIDLSQEAGSFRVRQVNLETGQVAGLSSVSVSKTTMLPKSSGTAVFWLTREK